MKILLANETAIYPHVGCLGVGEGHARMLGRLGHEVTCRFFVGELAEFVMESDEEIVDGLLGNSRVSAAIQSVDAIVVNGEGTIHHGSGRHLLGLLAAGQRLKKSTFLVNAVFQQSDCFREALLRLDDFVVRDQESYDYAISQGYRCRIAADSFLAAQFSAESLLPLEGRIVVTDWHPARNADVGAACAQYLRTDPEAYFLPLESSAAEAIWSHLPASLHAARTVITGRHHGVYLALAARRPFVAFGSNTYKMEGLCRMLGVEPLLCRTSAEIPRALAFCLGGTIDFARLVDTFLARFPLTTFDRLGSTGASREKEEVAQWKSDLAAWHTAHPVQSAMWSLNHAAGMACGLTALEPPA